MTGRIIYSRRTQPTQHALPRRNPFGQTILKDVLYKQPYEHNNRIPDTIKRIKITILLGNEEDGSIGFISLGTIFYNAIEERSVHKKSQKEDRENAISVIFALEEIVTTNGSIPKKTRMGAIEKLGKFLMENDVGKLFKAAIVGTLMRIISEFRNSDVERIRAIEMLKEYVLAFKDMKTAKELIQTLQPVKNNSKNKKVKEMITDVMNTIKKWITLQENN